MLLECNGDVRVRTSNDTAGVMVSILQSMAPNDQDKECLWALLLNNQNFIKHIDLVYMGASEGIIVNMRELFRSAVQHGGTGLIIAHNHPGGSLTPSVEDLALAKRIRRAGKLLGVRLVDFMIVTKDGQHWSITAEEKA